MNGCPELTMRDVSLHRPVIYGFTALWIVFYHTISDLPSGALHDALYWLKYNGAVGVEIFVLLSALGCYHSLERNPGVPGFYKRRFLRVAPCAFIVSVICYGLVGWIDVKEFLGAITFFPYWLGFDALWFVPLILTLYLVYPLIHRLQKRYPKAIWGLFAAAVAFSACCCHVLLPGNDHYLMPIVRLPTFLLGCAIAPWADRGGRIPRWVAPVSLALYLLISHLPGGTSDWFPRSTSYILLSVFAVIALTWLGRLLARAAILHPLYRFLALCGGVSLEIYLIYTRLLYFMAQYPAYASGRIGRFKLEMVTLLLTLILSLLLNRFCAWLARQFGGIRIPQDGA